MTKSLKAAVFLFVIGAIVVIGWTVYYRAVLRDPPRSDFLMLRAAGRAVLDGTDMYDVSQEGAGPFYYPPAMAIVMVPFAAMPAGVAVLAWYAVNLLAVWWVCRRMIALSSETAGVNRCAVVVLALLVNLGPLVDGFDRGQVSVVLFALMVEALWWYRRNRSFWSGFWIAVATGLKVYPGLLVLPLIVRRDWRGLAGFGAGSAGLLLFVPALVLGKTGLRSALFWATHIVLPFLYAPDYAQTDELQMFRQLDRANQSAYAVTARWLTDGSQAGHTGPGITGFSLSAGQVRGVVAVISLAMVGALVLLFRRVRDRSSLAESLAWALCMTAAVMISHVAWHNYYIVLSLLYALTATLVLNLESNRAPASGTSGRWTILGLNLTLWTSIICNWVFYALKPARDMGLMFGGAMLLFVGAAIVLMRAGSNQIGSLNAENNSSRV